MNISKPSVNKSNTGVRTLISHHRRRTLVTLKILFFVEQKNARCVRLGRSVVRLLFIRVMVGVIMVKVMFGLWLEVGDQSKCLGGTVGYEGQQLVLRTPTPANLGLNIQLYFTILYSSLTAMA